jgi:dihydropyrimidinase
LFPKKGTIAVGSDADIVVFDPNRKETYSIHRPHTHHMKVDYSAYEGFEVTGWSDMVLSRGRVVVDNGKLVTKGRGQYVKRAGAGELLR